MSVRDAAWLYIESMGWQGSLGRIDDRLQFLYHHALHYGTSVFEGIRAYSDEQRKGRYIFRLNDHVARLFRSAELYGIWPLPFSQDELAQACCAVLAQNPSHTYIRPVIFRGQGLGVDPDHSPICAAVLTAPWGKYLKTGWHNDGVKVGISNWRRPEADQLPVAAKGSANYVVGQLMKQEANRRGLAEMILRAPDREFVAEASGMNLFLVAGDYLITPGADASILMGITRATIMSLAPKLFGQSLQVVERPVFVDELLDVYEVFFTGTATEITPVTQIDDFDVGIGTSHAGCEGPITRELRNAYQEIVHGRLPEFEGWLTFVPDTAPCTV